jgi:amino acid transporter
MSFTQDVSTASSHVEDVSLPPNKLKRSLTLTDLIIYGLVYVGPIAPFAFYGYISNTAKGMVALAYIVGAVAMFFTAYSYKLLSADFPVTGSVYAYARQAIGDKTGFLAGWMLVLDYILAPAATYLAAASALHEIMTALPRWLLVLGFITVGTVVNYIGVQITALINKILLVVQLALFAVFVTVGLYALYHGAGAGHLTLKPLYQAHTFSLNLVFSAVSLAAISFLGFDAISTMAEETKDDSRRVIGRATLATLALAAALFVAQTWIAADLANGMTFASPDTAFYEIAAIAGGKTLSLITAFISAVVFGLSAASVVQASISRLLWAMARDGRMPGFMAAVHPKYKTPYRSLLVVAAISITVAMIFLNHFDVITILINFGALTGFLILHVTVVAHFVVRRGSRAYFKHLVCPAIGFCILGYVMYCMDPLTIKLGLGWLVSGLLGYWFFVHRPNTSTAIKAA